MQIPTSALNVHFYVFNEIEACAHCPVPSSAKTKETLVIFFYQLG